MHVLIYGVREFEALHTSVGIGGRVHGHLLHSSSESENQSLLLQNLKDNLKNFS